MKKSTLVFSGLSADGSVKNHINSLRGKDWNEKNQKQIMLF